MSTTNGPEDDPARTAAGAVPPASDDVRSATPPPPPPVGSPQGYAGGWSGDPGAGPTSTGWSGSDPSGGAPPSNRRSMLLGVAAGAGAVIVLGALAFALRPDGGSDSGGDAAPATTTQAPASPSFHQFNVEGFPDANTMAVIGSLDQDPSTFFVVGDGTTYECPQDGQLNLGVNDRGVENNSGAFMATITLIHG